MMNDDSDSFMYFNFMWRGKKNLNREMSKTGNF